MSKAKIEKNRLEKKGFLNGKNPYIMVAIFSFLIYGNTIFNKYNLDDELVTSISASRPHSLTSKGITAIPEIFKTNYYNDDQGYSYEYRPVVLATFAIEHSLFGDNPHTGHLINVFLYTFLCLLLLLVLNRLLNDYSRMLPLLITLLFAAFPVHTEVVASLKNRDEILALTGALGSLYFFINYVGRQKWVFLVGGMLCFIAAMLSKQTIISFVIIIPMLLFLFREVSLINALIVLAILLSSIFPLIQRTLLIERVGLITGVFLFTLLFYEIRYQRLTKKLNLSKRYNHLIKPRINKIRGLTSWQTLQSDESLGKNGYIALIVGLAVLSAALLIFGSTLYLFPLSMLIPLFIFIPSKAGRYLHWISAAIAIYLTYIFHKDSIFNIYYIFYAYSFLQKKKFKIIDAINAGFIFLAFLISCKIEIFREPMESFLGDIVIELIPRFIVVSIAIIVIKPDIKQIVKPIILLLAVLISSAGVINDGLADGWGNTVKHVGILLMTNTIVFCIFYLPHRKTLNILLFLIVLLTIEVQLIHSTHQSYVPQMHRAHEYIHNMQIQANEIRYSAFSNPIQENSSKTVYRPIDYVETVVSTESTMNEKLGTGIVIIGKYLRLTLVPYPMSFYYGYKCIEKTKLTQPTSLLLLLQIVCMIILGLWQVNKNRLLSAGLLIYFAAILPLANIVAPISGMMADRYLFIPSLGFCILLSLALFRLSGLLLEKGGSTFGFSLPRNFIFPTVAILVVYSGIAVVRNSQWYDALRLMRHDIKHLDESAQAQNLLAAHLVKNALDEKDEKRKRALLMEAETHYSKAVNIYPEFFNANYDLGRIRMMMGKLDEAEKSFDKVIKLDSTFLEPFFQVGLIKSNKGDYRGAVPYYTEYLKMIPGDLDALMSLSFCYVQLHDFNRALAPMKIAAATYPRQPEPLINLCRIFADLNQPDSALFYLHRAELIAPNHPDVIILKNAFLQSPIGPNN